MFHALRGLRREGLRPMLGKVKRKVLGRAPAAGSTPLAASQPAQVDHLKPVRDALNQAVDAFPVAQQYQTSNRYSAATQENRGPHYVPHCPSSESDAGAVKLIAFYLPQFHPIKENDAWWGRGFTEWSNVTRAIPQYVGHYQPHLPIDLGFYDLRIPEIQERQVELAKSYNIDGFAFYYYWFDGQRLLDGPLDSFVENPNIEFPFCLIWANENWTRRWDGNEDDVIMQQVHSPEGDVQFIADAAKYLSHPRYIRIDGRPVLIVYKVQLLPEAELTIQRWRDYCIKIGLGNPYLIAAQTMGFEDPRPFGFDAAMQFPPHNEHMKPRFALRTPRGEGPVLMHKEFEGAVFSYPSILKYKLEDKPTLPYTQFDTAFPMWDNTARRPNNGWIYAYSSPELYRLWLTRLCSQALTRPNPAERIVFLNAWNEWAEGAHLEPDRRYGYAYLKATRDAKAIAERGIDPQAFMKSLAIPVDEHLAELLSDPPVSPTVVYQMGKVGSISIVAELEAKGCGLPIIHSHMLEDLDRIAEVCCRQYPNPYDALYEVQRGKMIREWMAKAGPETVWNVITMAREPVGRNISAFFQNIEQFIPNIEARLEMGDLHVDEVHELFLQVFDSRAPEHWFEKQLKPVFNVDVYSKPYDFEKGFEIFSEGNRRVLVIRVEDMTRSVGAAMKAFMGIEGFAARRENRADQKYYSKLARMFKRKPLPPEYVEAMYGTLYSRHFYTEAELSELTQKWTKWSG